MRSADASEAPPDSALPISRTGDPLEREADRAAEQVEGAQPTIPTLTRRSPPAIQRQVGPGHATNASPASNEERVRQMAHWFMSGPYQRLRVDGMLRWVERSLAWGRTNPPNLIALHAVIPLLREWVGERVRPDNMHRHFGHLNGVTQGIAEGQSRGAWETLNTMNHRIAWAGFDSPLSGGLWDHYYQTLRGAREFLVMLADEAAITPMVDDLNRETSRSIVTTPLLLAGMGLGVGLVGAAATAEAPILAYALRHYAQQAMTWAILNPQSAIAVADFGANTVYGIHTAGGVEPFIQSLGTPEGLIQFMGSLMFLRAGMGGGSHESAPNETPPASTPSAPSRVNRAPTRTVIAFAALMRGTNESTPLGGSGQLLARPAITLASPATTSPSSTPRPTAAPIRAIQAASPQSASPTSPTPSSPTPSSPTPSLVSQRPGSTWLGARLDIVQADSAIHASIVGLTPGVPSTTTIVNSGPGSAPLPGFDEAIHPGETYHTDNLPTQFNTPIWRVVGVWRNQAGQIVRIRGLRLGPDANQDSGPVIGFVRNHPRAAAALGFRRTEIAGETFAEFPTPASGTLPGAMPLREVATDDPGGRIGRAEYLETVASGAIPTANQGGLSWHDRSHHFVGAAFVTGPLRQALTRRLEILRRIGAITGERGRNNRFVLDFVTPEVDRALEVGIQNVTDQLAVPTAQIDRRALVDRLRIIAHGGPDQAGVPAYDQLRALFSESQNVSPRTLEQRNVRWFRDLDASQRERINAVLAEAPPLLNEAQLAAEAEAIIGTLRRLDGDGP
ncbi:hypothetical protein ACNOYE_25265 [Nannocystaceae bacterium ST9]